MKVSSISVHYTPAPRETVAIRVAQTSPDFVGTVSRVSKPARLFDSSGSQTWKSAIRQGWNPALRASSATQRVIIFALVSFICALANQAHAQWAWQQIVLRPGWNAVFLEVDPAPEECAALFAGMPVESVWDWNRSADSPQFVQDPGTLIPGAPG